MTDIIVIAVIVAYFVTAALLVRLLDHMIAGSGRDTDSGDQAPEPGPGSSRPI